MEEKRGGNGRNRGGGGILDKTHPPDFCPPPVYNSAGSIFCKTKLKPRRSPGLGIPAPKGDAHSKKKIINMHGTH